MNNITSYLSFREVFETHDENVSNKWDNYLEVYDEHFYKFIGKHANYLEIGVQNGGSLQIASKYFVNAGVYGIDINPKVCQMDLGYNITTYCFDINDQAKFQENFKDVKFDIILDDASHTNADIINTFKILFSQVKPGGVYLVEDIQTAYWPNYGGGYLKPESAIEFFKGFVDLLNAYHHNVVDPTVIQNFTAEEKYVFEWLYGVAFYDDIAVVKKLIAPRSYPYEQTYTGNLQPILDIKNNEHFLYVAVLSNDTRGIEKLLVDGVNINNIHSSGGTALYWAAQINFFDGAKKLLEAGADTEIKATNNMTPLTVSVQENNYNITKLLVESGADLENPNGFGSTPLYLAAYFGFDNILQFLLDKGANKNATVHNLTAFERALQQEHPSSAILLAGSKENFCQEIQNTEYGVKYAELCGQIDLIV